MCIKPKTPDIPAAKPAPGADDTRSAVVDQRRKVRDQPGLYGNIFTSVLGDSNYGARAGARPQLATGA